MSFRFRRSIKIAPGVRINFGKKSHSWTIGGKAARTTYNPVTKKTTQSYSTPLKGLYWSKQYSNKGNQSDPQNSESSGPLGLIGALLQIAWGVILLAFWLGILALLIWFIVALL